MPGHPKMVPARNLRLSARAPADEAPAYAELHCLSNFSFLRGASHAEELVVQAKELGYAALAITDECSLAGVVRAHSAVKKAGGAKLPLESTLKLTLKLIIGAEFTLACGLRMVVIARNRAGYGRLSRLITRGRRAAAKGSYALKREDVEEFIGDAAQPREGHTALPREHESVGDGTLALWLPALDAGIAGQGEWIARTFAGRAWIAVELTRDGQDPKVLGGRGKLSDSVWVRPPSATISSPLTYEDSSLARKRTSLAISAGSAIRRTGTRLRRCDVRSSCSV